MNRIRNLKRSTLIGIAVGITLLLAGVSVYAINADPTKPSVPTVITQSDAEKVDDANGEKGITKSEAEEIALSQVKGATRADITKCYADWEDGRAEYDVEIIYNGYDYDFEILAEDGRILESSKELADAEDLAKREAKNNTNGGQSGNATGSNSAGISKAEANSIALSKVPGASSKHITKSYKDWDDGRAEYDIEIVYNGYEYDFEILVSNGKIVSWDKERAEGSYKSNNSGSKNNGSNSGSSNKPQSGGYHDYDDDWDDRYDDDDDDWDDKYDDDRYDRGDDWDDRYDD